MTQIEGPVETTLNEREMRVEHAINFVRMSVFAFGVGADVLSALLNRLATTEYVVFISGASLLAALYLWVVHSFSRGRRYHGWLKYLTITVDCLLPGVFLLEMRRPEFAAAVNMDAVVSVDVVVVVIIIMLNAMRLRAGAVVYATALGTLLVAASTLLISREPIERVWFAPLVVVAGAVTWWISRNVGTIIRELRRRERLARFLPAEVAAMIEGSDLDVALGGKTTRATVLFADIRGFTTFSERHTPEEVVEILNEHFTVMSACIRRAGGMIDKYIGDAVMAVFGAPLARDGDAARAVSAATAMLQELERLNRQAALGGRAPVSMGIALHTGEVVAGNVGSPERMDYSVIGDTVNLTSRLEELNKEFGTALIMSEDTCREAGLQPPPRFLGEVPIRGREGTVKIYTLPAAAAGS